MDEKTIRRTPYDYETIEFLLEQILVKWINEDRLKVEYVEYTKGRTYTTEELAKIFYGQKEVKLILKDKDET